MTHFLLKDYNILPNKELHCSPWVFRVSILEIVIMDVGRDLKVGYGPLGLRRTGLPGLEVFEPTNPEDFWSRLRRTDTQAVTLLESLRLLRFALALVRNPFSFSCVWGSIYCWNTCGGSGILLASWEHWGLATQKQNSASFQANKEGILRLYIKDS